MIKKRYLVKAGMGVVILCAFIAHVYIVMSIARQPLNVNRYGTAAGSAVHNLYNDTIPRIGPGADFFAVYHAGQAIQSGLSPYENLEQPRKTPYFFPFRYLPVAGQTIGKAFSVLTPLNAYRLWVVVLEIVLGMIIIFFAWGTRDALLRVFAICILLLSSPYFLELHMGQFTFICVAMVCAAVLTLSHKNDRPGYVKRVGAALLLGCSVLIKPFTLICIPALLRHWRSWWPGLAACIVMVLFLTRYFSIHSELWRQFAELNFTAPVGGLDSGNFGFSYLLFMATRDMGLVSIADNWNTFAQWFYKILLALTAGVVLFARNARPETGVVALLTAHFLGYIHVWEHHVSAVILLGLLLVHSIKLNECRGLRYTAMLALTLLALPSPFVFFDKELNPSVWDPSETWPRSYAYLLVMSKALPTLALYATSMLYCMRHGFTFSRSGT